jgi:hypothetical protein
MEAESSTIGGRRVERRDGGSVRVEFSSVRALVVNFCSAKIRVGKARGCDWSDGDTLSNLSR